MTDAPPPIYTRGGDEGQTSLYDGSRTPKCHPRIEALGTLDELTSYLAVCRHHVAPDIARRLRAIQDAIYRLNAIIATPGPTDAQRAPANDTGTSDPTPPPDPNENPSPTETGRRPMPPPSIEDLEAAIDALRNAALAPHFLQVGSTEAAAHLHYARTLCRRAERRLWRLAETEPCDRDVLRYVNRLSDLLYVLAVHHESDPHYLTGE